LRFYTKTKQELMKESRDYLVEHTDLRNFNPGSVIRSILESINGHLAEQYEIMSLNLLQTYVTTAVGDALDEIGALFGLVRGDAKRAVDTSHSNFRFYIDTLTGYVAETLAAEQYTANQTAGITPVNVVAAAFTIPNGTSVSAGGIVYKTTEAALFSGSTTEVYVPVIANGYGESYNVPAYALKSYTLGDEFTIIRKYLYSENAQDISSGKFIESDDELRYRIVNAHLESAKANEIAVRIAALSVPGVTNVYLREYAAGIGTFAVNVIGDTPIPNAGLLLAVQQAIEGVKSFGIRAVTSYPDYKGFEGTFKLRFSATTSGAEKSLIMQQAQMAIELYINNLGFAGELIANEVIQRIMEINEKIVDVRTLLFGVGDYNPITHINEDYHPIIFMNQRVDADEMPVAVPGGIVVC
jgi:uncharacterized phage protein gp47/JayE